MIAELRGFYHERLLEARGRSDFNSLKKKLEKAEDFAEAYKAGVSVDEVELTKRRTEQITSLGAISSKRKGPAASEQKRILVELLKNKDFESRRKKALKSLKSIVVSQPVSSGASEKIDTGNGDGVDLGNSGSEVEDTGGECSTQELGDGPGAGEKSDDDAKTASVSKLNVEELVSTVLWAIENVLGDGHEDFVQVAKRVEEAIGRWADVSD